ncbi:hypothetical protein [Staphylococcus simulans]|uniref:hypothetical protein n=1 Tax=Staphylococcus simulans TaxID=1286 RepID=UPI0027EB4C40|nr:hypothetical protein [Staphylococcus simulans]MDQ7113916.1 hypothetical protein [Staphylococcus simulans]MDQ7117673.1 hypothetical protein [Staphylococcus simulans]
MNKMDIIEKIREIRKNCDGDLDYFRRYYLKDSISLYTLEELLYGEIALDNEYLQHLLDNAICSINKLKKKLGSEIDNHKEMIQGCENKLSELNNISFIQ